MSRPSSRRPTGETRTVRRCQRVPKGVANAGGVRGMLVGPRRSGARALVPRQVRAHLDDRLTLPVGGRWLPIPRVDMLRRRRPVSRLCARLWRTRAARGTNSIPHHIQAGQQLMKTRHPGQQSPVRAHQRRSTAEHLVSVFVVSVFIVDVNDGLFYTKTSHDQELNQLK